MTIDKERVRNFNARLDAMDESQIQAESEKQAKKDEKQFEDFKDCFKKGICGTCKNKFTDFFKSKPCAHWLMKPDGFRKRHFPLICERRSFHEINSFLRWVANIEKPFSNINDLKDEKSPGKIIEETIRFRNFEWSFSCSESDMKGHGGTKEGIRPHYHFQMKENGFVTIGYNDFHPVFHDYDFFWFAVKNGDFPKLQHRHNFDAGMQTIMEFVPEEQLIEALTSAPDDADSAPLKTEILITAKEGKKISGEQIAAMLEKRKRTGRTLASLAKELEDVSVETFTSPGPGVPEIAKRTAHKPR